MKDIYESPAVKKMQASQRVAEQWGAFARRVEQNDSAGRYDLSPDDLRNLLDACDHAKSSYAEEAAAAELQKLRDDLARIERKQDENQKAQAKDTQKAYKVSLIALGLNALAIIVAVLIARLS